MIYNEVINAARHALHKAVDEVIEFSPGCSRQRALELIFAVWSLEGSPERLVDHDIRLYDEVRRWVR